MSALGSIIFEISAKWLFKLAPPLVTQWLLPPEKMASKIKILLGSGHSVKLCCQNDICSVEMGILIQNKSFMRCVIDRVIVRFDGLHDLNELVYLQPIVIESLEDQFICLRRTLSGAETTSVKLFLMNNRLSNPRITVQLVVNSPIGTILKGDYLTYPGDIPTPFSIVK